jgi:Acyl-CoA dehydrogenase, N-terminal domain
VALGDHARRFASERIAPGFQERDRTRVLDRGLMREMGAMGFIAPELPERFGGQGLGCLAAGVIHEEEARADLSLSYVNLLASLNGQILSRRRHGADHEDHHRPRPRGPPRRAGLTARRPGERTRRPVMAFDAVVRAARRAECINQRWWHERTSNDELDAWVAACPDRMVA